MSDPAVFQGRNWLSFKPVIAAALTQCDRLEAEADRPASSDFAALRERYLACLSLTAGLFEAVRDVKATHADMFTAELRGVLETDLEALAKAGGLPPEADEAAIGAALDDIWRQASRVSDDLIRLEGEIT